MNQELSALQEENSRLKKQLHEQSLAGDTAKSAFIANMSHEIRTPLNGILGALQILKEDKLPEDKLNLISLALLAGENLLHVLDDILDIACIEAENMRILPETIELKPFFQRMEDFMHFAAKTRNVTLSFDIRPDTRYSIEADRARLQQILINLIGNAIKFTSMGSVVIKADIERVADGAEFVCSVSDTGIGINEDQQDGIFKLFTQGEFSYTKKIAGTGLGLTLVKRLLDIMHGSIGFHSSPGEGSSFCFRLPVKMEAVLDTDTPDTNTPDKKLEILVIEDNEINRITLEQMLAALGHNATAAETASEALAIIAGKHFDMILLDIQLPDMDGITAFSSIRKLSEAPVVAITGFAAADHRMRILDSGINGFLAKPFTMNELKNTVRDFS